MSAVSVKPNVV